jgi:enediyne polyketide synthase
MTAHEAEPVAIVGMACRFPDADDPGQLWQAVLDQRRPFRRIPPERLDLAEYLDPDPAAPDRTYGAKAALLEGWTFDRARFRIPGATFRTTDPAHWLALETAARALDDAGYPAARGLDPDRTAVVIGNSLTGEVTRANTLRLRWPYVRRVLTEALGEAGLPDTQVTDVLERTAARYLAPFPPVGDETLAGGLSNTIAGRVCNHFDFHGGGYTVDGACASSLLAVITACRTLRDGDADVVLAGGVDLSVDPFELVGFAKAGALAKDRMLVYDKESDGFVPGEGCGVVVLMRASDARAAGLRVYAEIVGWGLSSDGQGGITRPERQGQVLAMRRAYELAGIPASSVGLVEGHGTGTAVGDATELAALTELLRDAPTPVALGSVKANIGHTKAAAGIAGLIKATMSVASGMLPPTTGCRDPHPMLEQPGAPLRVLSEPAPWAGSSRVAGVSAMGFGGINAHVTIHSQEPPPVALPEPALRVRRPQPETDVITLSGSDVAELRAALDRLVVIAPRLSEAELHDLACQLGTTATDEPIRIGLVAATPEQLAHRAGAAASLLTDLRPGRMTVGDGVYLGQDVGGRVTLLLPGHGAPVRDNLGALGQQLREPNPPAGSRDGAFDTAVAQPAIYRATMAALRWLDLLGVTATAAIGHSLGEIAGLVWAGCLSPEDGQRLVTHRGRIMGSLVAVGTGMVSVAVDRAEAEALCAGTGLVVAGYNGPSSHVLSGPRDQVLAVHDEMARRGAPAAVLPVSLAFHSAAMSGCVEELGACLRTFSYQPPAGRVVSTVRGRALTAADRLDEVLADQVTAPVRFWQAVNRVLPETDVFCEAGPGRVLSGLVRAGCSTPVVGLDVGSREDGPLAETAAALFAAGAIPKVAALFAERAARPIDIWRDQVFMANPCSSVRPAEPAPDRSVDVSREVPVGVTAALVLGVLSEATELPPELIPLSARLLDDLHLSSLRVAQAVVGAADAVGRRFPPELAATMAGVTVAELITTVEGLPQAEVRPETAAIAGVAPWLQCFVEGYSYQLAAAPADAGFHWRPHIAPHHPLSDVAWQLFRNEPTGGPRTELVYLPDTGDPAAVTTLLAAARAATGSGRLVAVTHDSALSGFLRSLCYEYPDLGVTSLRVSATVDGLIAASRYATAESGVWRELVIDGDTRTTEQVLCRLWRYETGELPVGSGDVLLVTGGGKGIGYECALAVAQTTGAALALLGRASPERDSDLRANLDRLHTTGVRWAYEPADVTDLAGVSSAVQRLTERLGAVTALLHASGVNEPTRFAELDEARVRGHLAPKLTGLRNVLSTVDQGRLRLLVTFGSVIGRHGLAGECHYALANGVLRAEAERLAGALADCRVLNVDWSVWSGSGMGERLGVLDSLRRMDVTPIPVDRGVDVFLRLLRTASLPVSVAVHGRLGDLVRTGTTPPGRFVRDVKVCHPEVELVADTVLDLERAPYLTDHRIDGLPVLPGVVGLEAMAQGAAALAGRPLRCAVEIAMDRPVVVPEHGTRTVRVCALRREDTVEVVLRTDETDFEVDHMRATFPLTQPGQSIWPPDLPKQNVSLTAEELYGPLYFHSGPFRLVRGFSALAARFCRATLAAPHDAPAGDVPLLGVLTSNDATVHVLQACVPHRRLLPVGCERFTVAVDAGPPHELHATERYAAGSEYVWDVVVTDADGKIARTWQGLRLRDVGPLPRTRPWPPALLAVYLQRSVIELGLDPDATVERWEPVLADTNEKPEVDAHRYWHVHEPMRNRLAESPETVSARLRTMRSCLAEAGYPAESQLQLRGVYDGGWVVLSAGTALIASVVVPVAGFRSPMSVAILTDNSKAS